LKEDIAIDNTFKPRAFVSIEKDARRKGLDEKPFSKETLKVVGNEN
jgi:hypothetical protein